MTDSQQAEAGKTVKFGIGQIGNPTPIWAKTIFRVVSFIVGIWALIQHLNIGLSEPVVATINEWAVAVVPIVHFTIKFFGWDYKAE